MAFFFIELHLPGMMKSYLFLRYCWNATCERWRRDPRKWTKRTACRLSRQKMRKRKLEIHVIFPDAILYAFHLHRSTFSSTSRGSKEKLVSYNILNHRTPSSTCPPLKSENIMMALHSQPFILRPRFFPSTRVAQIERVAFEIAQRTGDTTITLNSIIFLQRVHSILLFVLPLFLVLLFCMSIQLPLGQAIAAAATNKCIAQKQNAFRMKLLDLQLHTKLALNVFDN